MKISEAVNTNESIMPATVKVPPIIAQTYIKMRKSLLDFFFQQVVTVKVLLRSEMRKSVVAFHDILQ